MKIYHSYISSILFLTCLPYNACTSTKDVHLPNEKQIIETLKGDLKNKINAVYENHPNAYKDTTDFEVHYFSLVNQKDLTGVYIYSVIGSHRSRKNIFTYDKNGTHIINTSNIEVAFKEIKTFLIEQKFTDTQLKQSLETITKLLNENNTDSF